VHQVVGILLAAGRGTRFGGPKLMARLADGTLLGVAAARRLLAAVPEAVAVVHPDDRELGRHFVAEGLRVLECPDAERGMGVSLAAGVAATATAQGWVIALADMPYIRVSTIERVARALEEGAALAAPCYRGERGHPVGLGREFGAALQALAGDHGARELLAQHAARLTRLEVEDPGILLDIDTPADLGAAFTR
jgi:molybdenum cofactor cytidylyltransferase